MADLPTTRTQIAAAERQITTLGAQLRQENLALDQALRLGDQAGAATHRQTIATLEQQRTQAKATLTAALQSVESLRKTSVAAALPANPIGALDSSVPLVLFPVRLETRFQNKDLLIRIYPDDVHMDTHEPELTAEEITRGQRFWTQVWHAGTGADGPPREKRAWAMLADSAGAERAAWIARSLEPRNSAAAASADDAPLPTAPDFPAPPQRETSWTRRPYATVMPDRWIALGYGTQGRAFMAVGNVIPDRLVVGPAPDNDSPAQTGDALTLIDDEMRWLVDFNAAVQNGMAIRVTLPDAVASGLSRLIVLGVKGSMTVDESTAALSAMLDGQHYTRGLSFLPRGTATNNTETAPSGYGSNDPGHERSFAAERQAPLFQTGNQAAGDVAARALGLDPSIFVHSWRADDVDAVPARNLGTALWSATWGYYLEKRLPGLVSDAGIATFRSHYTRFVRGGGPLPALRLRNQPYGLLPVTALDLWAPAEAGDIDGRALTVLRSMQDVFSRAVSNVPRMTAVNPDQDLVAVLRMSPVSNHYSVRHMVGPRHVSNFFQFTGVPITAAWWNAQASAARVDVAVPGLPANTPQARAVFSGNTKGIDSKPLVIAGVTQDYLKALASADLNTLISNAILPAGQRPLLYDLARHSLLLAWASAAYRMQLRAGLITADQRLEPELVDIDPDVQTLTVWRQFDRTIPAVTGAQTLRDFLNDPAHESNPDVAELGEVRASLRQLATMAPEKLDMLLRETIDTASHRLDAWVTSLATRRLDFLRKRRATGVMFGGYGWVEDLRPAGATRSDGYVLTPSISHANTAAMLASGYMAHRGTGSVNPFAVDLSSERVRTAYRLIEGVRTGQPIGALLGYQIERAMHDQQLSPWVAPFRKLAPLATTPTTGNTAMEAVAANNVVHGVKILDLWKSKDPRFVQLRTLANLADFVKIDALFTKMADQLDALADVIMADNVHQVAEGNFDRAAMTLSAVIAGQSIPDPEVLRTPRTGTGLSHRVVTLLDPAQLATPAWQMDALQARVGAEPVVNAWAARMLGDPNKITCRAQYAGNATVRVLKLAELKLSPLDVIYATASSAQGHASEFEQRLTNFLLRSRPAGVAPDAAVTLDYSRDPQAAADVLSFDDLLAMTTAMRALLQKARPLTATDLTPADQTIAAGIDTTELKTRADRAVALLRSALNQLKQALAAAGTPLEPVRTDMMRLVHLGLNNAVPVSAADGTANDSRLPLQAAAAVDDVNDRLKKLDAMTAGFDRNSAAPQAILEFDTTRLRTVFGPDFIVLPRFISANAAEVATAFANSDALQQNRRIEVVTWFARAARVRDGLSRFADVLRLAEVFGRGTPAWTVGQMPFVAGESWAALPLSSAGLGGGRLSLVAHGPVKILANQPLAGMVFDEWSEVIPNRTETAAMAFHYDRPSSRSPQTILVAVAPDVSKPWDLLTLEQLLRETLALARLRMVDQDAMLELDHFLPALTFAINAAGETISTDLRAL
jgi:hypothetical protein